MKAKCKICLWVLVLSPVFYLVCGELHCKHTRPMIENYFAGTPTEMETMLMQADEINEALLKAGK